MREGTTTLCGAFYFRSQFLILMLNIGVTPRKRSIFLDIYHNICGVDLSEDKRYVALIEQWRLQKLNNIPTTLPTTKFVGRLDSLEEIGQKLKVWQRFYLFLLSFRVKLRRR